MAVNAVNSCQLAVNRSGRFMKQVDACFQAALRTQEGAWRPQACLHPEGWRAATRPAQSRSFRTSQYAGRTQPVGRARERRLHHREPTSITKHQKKASFKHLKKVSPSTGRTHHQAPERSLAASDSYGGVSNVAYHLGSRRTRQTCQP